MNYKHFITVLAWTALLPVAAALAHDGEDHSEAPVAPAASGSGPRIETQSELFELVGRVEHGVLTIWLDRFADNAPVKDARIEIEAGKTSGTAVASKDGTYTFKSPLFDKPGPMALTFTISAGEDDDLLAGELLMPTADEHDHAPAKTGMAAAFTPLRMALALAVLLLAVFGVRFALRARSHKEFK
jgi:hypothetical protein